MGQGSAGGYLASMSTNLKNFSETNRGLVVGILASCFGLSGFVFSSTYSYIFHQKLEDYLLFTSIIGTVVIASGAIFMNANTKKPEPKKEEPQVDNTQEEANPLSEGKEEGAAVAVEEAQVVEEEKKVYADISANKKLDPPSVNPLRMLISLDFYLIFVAYFLGAGCGLVIINNLGSIVMAYGGYKGQQNVMVQLLSVL